MAFVSMSPRPSLFARARASVCELTNRGDVEHPPAGLSDVGENLGIPILLLCAETRERRLELAPRLSPHRHTDEGVATPRVQLCDHVASSQPLRESDRSLVVDSGVACREELHGLIAGGDTESQRRFVEPACQGVPGKLRGRRATACRASMARRWNTRLRASPASL